MNKGAGVAGILLGVLAVVFIGFMGGAAGSTAGWASGGLALTWVAPLLAIVGGVVTFAKPQVGSLLLAISAGLLWYLFGLSALGYAFALPISVVALLAFLSNPDSVQKLSNARPGEVRALLWSFLYFFFLLSTYYMLLPLRDTFGIRGGAQDLPWLFLGTFIVSLITAPLQAAIAARLPRQRFVPVMYLFLVANMLIFWFLLKTEVSPDIVAKAFFMWITVFSVFTVSIFWSFLSDIYSSEQSKRLFGFVAAGGSVGSILGPMITRQLVTPIGVHNLLLISSLLLICAVLCANRLEKAAPQLQAADPNFVAASSARAQNPVGGGVFDGFGLLFKSPFLGGIALWVFLLSLLGTFLYFVQANLVASMTTDTAERAKIFSLIATWVGILSLVFQLVGTGRLIKKIGTGAALAILPAVFVIGFGLLTFLGTLFVVAAFQACQRAANFGIANVARESLWPVVTREEKFKAKNIVDGAVFRGADFVNAFIYTGLAKVLAVQPYLAGLAAIIAAGWFTLSLGLGRTREKRAAEQARLEAQRTA